MKFDLANIIKKRNDLDQLAVPFTKEEIDVVIKELPADRAPGPDGLHAVFYKSLWPMLGDDVVMEVLNAVNSHEVPRGWNDTIIVMIPKVNTPEKVSQFRPISLCNVVYKTISKMIAARLKNVLPEIISPTQSAFVPGRLITDNVLIAYESLHAIKQRRAGKEGWCAVKLDMHKAYDRVEWVFLEAILLKLGFKPDWVRMIMACVSSVEYKVRYNSVESETIKPSRGLREGDPLSPYLFLLCTGGLIALLNHAEQ